MVVEQSSKIPIFCGYAHEDGTLLRELRNHLSSLQRQNEVTIWHDGDINAGEKWEQEIKQSLDDAKIILFLISSDFIASDYCYGTEMKQAIERYEQGEARIILVILRPVNWRDIRIGNITLAQLQALPKDAKPVTTWENHDEAWNNVTEEIKAVVRKLRGEQPPLPSELKGGSSSENDGNNQAPPPNPPDPVVVTSPASPTQLETDRHTISRRTVIRRGLVAVAGGSILALGEVLIHSLGAKAPPSSVIPGSTRVASVTAEPTSFASPTSLTTPTPLVGQLLNTYQGHTDDVRSIAWASNGYIASGSYDKTVQVWKWNASKAFYIYLGHSAIVESVAWSSDGKYIASASRDRSVQVWNALSGATLVTYKGHENEVYTVAYSPNGQYIASGGLDKTVQIHTWNATTADIFTYKGHTYSVYTVAWSPNGSYIASADSGGNVHVWDFRSGKLIFIYKHENDVNSVAWSPDGLFLASGSNDTYTSNSNTLQVWKMNSRQQQPQYSQRTGTIYSLRWSPKNNGHLALAGAKGVVQIWDNSGNKISSFKGLTKNVLSVAWSSDGKYIASGGEDKTVLIWSAN